MAVIPKPCKCLRCGYQWESKVLTPKACPACKSYRWDKKPKAAK